MRHRNELLCSKRVVVKRLRIEVEKCFLGGMLLVDLLIEVEHFGIIHQIRGDVVAARLTRITHSRSANPWSQRTNSLVVFVPYGRQITQILLVIVVLVPKI